MFTVNLQYKVYQSVKHKFSLVISHKQLILQKQNFMQKRVTKSEKLIKEVRRNTRQVFSSEQKILIVIEGMRGEMTVAELCRKHGISEPTYYKWNKEFIEAGKKRLSGDETREATSDEVKELRKENTALKESLADLVIRYDIVKKSLNMLE